MNDPVAVKEIHSGQDLPDNVLKKGNSSSIVKFLWNLQLLNELSCLLDPCVCIKNVSRSFRFSPLQI